jgi:hypothetical protein
VYPDELIELRQGARVIEKSGRFWTLETAPAVPAKNAPGRRRHPGARLHVNPPGSGRCHRAPVRGRVQAGVGSADFRRWKSRAAAMLTH